MPQVSQKRSASVTIDLTPEQREEYEAIAEGRAELNRREGALRAAIRDLPDVKAAARLAATTTGGMGSTDVDFHAQSKACTVRFEIDERVELSDDVVAKMRLPKTSVFMDPKTLNLLLSGKLISAKEKRDLVRTVYPALGAAIVDDLVEDQPDQDEAPESGGYAGEIEVGDRFVWEPDKPHARELIRVSRIEERAGDERLIYSVPVATGRLGGGFLADGFPNDESRFREACVKLEGEIR